MALWLVCLSEKKGEREKEREKIIESGRESE